MIAHNASNGSPNVKSTVNLNVTSYLTALIVALAAVSAPAAQAQITGFSGFAPTNGTAVNNGASLTLTSNVGSEAGSAFNLIPQNVASGFDASFLYTVSGDKSADGLTFTLENDPRGTSALGSGGGYLGYGGNGGITQSAAIEFNFNLSNSTGFDTDGGIGTPTGIGNGVSLASGLPVAVHLVYDGTVLTETLTQATSGGSNVFETHYTTGSLQGVLGDQAAFVGFTGSDGGSASTQVVSSFSFTPAAVPEASQTASLGLLLLLGLGGLVVAAWRKKATNKKATNKA